jgi:hypothetical protein
MTQTTTTTENNYSVFDVKINRRWKRVRATSIMALAKWAESNGNLNWVMVGMMSRAEIILSKNLEMVA